LNWIELNMNPIQLNHNSIEDECNATQYFHSNGNLIFNKKIK